ncbi:MAG: DNA topoisomerase I [uncultured Thermomicrobiales bacterium]|uniref:DNA topoisomerase 1 n=1 Tax=uncultured Thermomicrobiales bacterium TaxID=1645740 RepID=A0A6J4TIC8_9BACT|nr:MAG: DNA topoisomerase I [uncultured Thermomicrobiales bacterium]
MPTTRTRTTKTADAAATAAPKPATKRASATAAKTAKPANGASANGAGRGKLVIVESPAKAKTIGKYLGPGYVVKASMGHVRDLPKSTLGVEVDDDFAPKYLVPRDKVKLVKELKASVANAREIILATDPDREGEAIAWHLVHATEAAGNGKPIRRVVFHEITSEAVTEAMAHPRDIDMGLVDAQQARRVLDRLVGYGVSPLLWKKVKRGLSAGRVQTAALRIVVEREREVLAFVPEEYWSLDADLAKQTGKEPRPQDRVRATLSKIRGKKADLKSGWETQDVVAALDGASYRVATVTKKEAQRRPAAPFITSTLQQEASRKLGYNVRRTMQIAQDLYEGVDLGPAGTQGLITYMRTDSTNVAASAQQAARAVISVKFGPEYVPEKPPLYAKKSKGAQEAHEAIRPTAPQRDPASVKAFLAPQQFRLYQLIWQRFMASQMRPALLDNTGVDIAAGAASEVEGGQAPFTFRATGSVVKFPGFMAVYQAGRDDGDTDELDKGALPPLAEGEDLDLLTLLPEQHFTQPPPRYSEATLVKALEEQGIGRPSTYAPTIGTLLARSYVAVEEKKLVPTELGIVVNDLLVEHFPTIFDVGFTSRLEEELDEIAVGDRAWIPTLHEFYGPFTQTLKLAESTMERVRLKDEPAGEDCEKCGRPLVIKLGKFGKFMACSGFPECRNAKPLLLKVGVPCPTCHEGEIVERRSKKGRVFFGCERYPACDFVAWNKPVAQPCPACGSPYMEEAGRKGQIKCPKCQHTGATLLKTG